MQNTCTQLIRYSCVPHTGTAHFPKQDRWQCWTRKTQSFGFRGGRYGPVLAVTQVLRLACRTLLIVHYWLLLMPTPPPLSFCWRPIYLIYLHLPVSLSGQDSVTAIMMAWLEMIVRRCCRRRGLLFRDQKLRRRKCTTQALLLPDISPSLSAAVTLSITVSRNSFFT